MGFQRSGSEVMGFGRFAVGFHQPPTLCKLALPDRLRHSLFIFSILYHVHSEKSNVFLSKKFVRALRIFVQNRKEWFFTGFLLTNQTVYD